MCFLYIIYHFEVSTAVGAQASNVSVTVLERSLDVQSQGAGIVLGRWSTKFFQAFDKTDTKITVPALRRQFFNRDGSNMMEEKIELGMTSWDKVCEPNLRILGFNGKSSSITFSVPISTAMFKMGTLIILLRQRLHTRMI